MKKRRAFDETEHARAISMNDGLDAFGLFAPITHEIPVRATTRTVAGPPPETEWQKKHAVLMAMEEDERTKEMMRWVRGELKALYLSRAVAANKGFEKQFAPSHHFVFVTSDDADRLLKENPLYAEQASVKGKQQWRGQLFRKGFADTGKSVPSLRRGQKAAKLTCWRAI